MSLFEYTPNAITKLSETTFAERSIGERADLQRLLKENIGVIANDVLIIAEEFCDWEDSRRRIDLLAVDQAANLVVIELKRTEDGGHMDLQAIRYAAMISRMTFSQAVSTFAKYRKSSEDEAQVVLLEFLGWDNPNDDFAKFVRIVLVSAEFSKEVATSVMWLNDQGLDLTCVRLRPYNLDGTRTILDVQRIIPLPEADDITVQMKRKAEESKLARTFNPDFSKYTVTVGSEAKRGLTKRAAAYEVVKAVMANGVSAEKLTEHIPSARWIWVEGEVDAEEFQEKATMLQAPLGGRYDLRRYFCDDDELFRSGGRTYSLINQWSANSLPFLDGLIALVPHATIRFEKEV